MTWKTAKQELLDFGYEEGKEYLIQHENDEEISLIVEGDYHELEAFGNVLEAHDLNAKLVSARIVISIVTHETRRGPDE